MLDFDFWRMTWPAEHWLNFVDQNPDAAIRALYRGADEQKLWN
jgi:hypothetical protein